MEKKRKKKTKCKIQLQIDFNLPYELTPTMDDLRYELELIGNINVPYTLF